MNKFIKLFLIVSVLVLAIDGMWIAAVMKDQYSAMIPRIQKQPMVVRMLPTILSYLTIILSVVLFSLPNIDKSNRLVTSMMYGGVLGALMYGMFSFTNHALITNWSPVVVALDTVWGFVLYTLVSYIASYLY
jgi:uncharacterized membrane protein